jgi:hypothetical protein
LQPFGQKNLVVPLWLVHALLLRSVPRACTLYLIGCVVVQGFMPRMGLVHYVVLMLVATISRVAFVDAVDSPPVVWTWVGGESGTTGSVSLGTPYVYSSFNRPGKMYQAWVLNGANSSLWLVTVSGSAWGVWAIEPRTCRLASYSYCNGCPVSAGVRGQESASTSPGLRVLHFRVLMVLWCVF